MNYPSGPPRPPPPPPPPPPAVRSGARRPPPPDSKSESNMLVNSTISQDRTHGATAIEESNLKSLNRDLIALSLKSDSTAVPSDPVQKDKPLGNRVPLEEPPRRYRRGHSSSRTSIYSRSPSPRRGPTTGSAMNARKRLRDELEDEARLGPAPQPSLEATNDETQTLEGLKMGDLDQRNEALKNRMPRALTAKEEELFQQLRLDAESEDTITSSSSDSEEDSNSDDSESDEPGLPFSSSITKDTHLAETERPSAEVITALWNDARSYRIICAINCSARHPSNHHFATFYEDVPFKSKESGIVSRHLSGHIPIPDLNRYLETIEKCSFIVFRIYACDKSGQDAPRIRPTVLPKVVPMSSKSEYQEYISITSQRLERVIQDLKSCSSDDCMIPDVVEAFGDLTFMGAPYRFIYHYRSELLNAAQSAKSSTRYKVLALLNYVEATVGAKHKRADDLFRRGVTDLQSMNFLFRPNDILIVSDRGRPTAHALCVWLPNLLLLEWACWNWNYDGTAFTRKATIVHGPNPTEIKDKLVVIQELTTYPITYASQKVREGLQKQGRKFWGLRYQSYISYTGWDVLKDENHIATRCVVDYQTYRRFHPVSTTSHQMPVRYDGRSRPTFWPDSTPSEEEFYLMPPNVHGFVLQEKKWVNLWVENVGEVSWNKDAFDRLVLPPKTKDLVKALVMVRASKQRKKQQTNLPTKRDDIIASKGNGLIVLLHGGPGTGKTLTAGVWSALELHLETSGSQLLNSYSVAELAEMPLYRVTCGDIGTNAEAVEKYLQTILYLGKTWNCVLLLDEADVFLEERTLSDLQRNSLVSVFLRILEYYEGILILTSNRVGTFDEAFRSRMQLALHYPNLTPVSRKKIWQNFFDMLQEDEEDVDLDEIKLHIDELADKEMNGREIRNTLITAKQLALYQKETLTWDHLEHTVKTAGDFNKYLKNVHGHTDEQRAREEGIR